MIATHDAVLQRLVSLKPLIVLVAAISSLLNNKDDSVLQSQVSLTPLIVLVILSGIRELFDTMNYIWWRSPRRTDEYIHMVEISQEKAPAVTVMKESRDTVRVAVKRG